MLIGLFKIRSIQRKLPDFAFKTVGAFNNVGPGMVTIYGFDVFIRSSVE